MATYNASRQQARRRRKRTTKAGRFFKKEIDERYPLPSQWIVTVVVTFSELCVKRNNTAASTWIGAMVGLRGRHMAWYAHLIEPG